MARLGPLLMFNRKHRGPWPPPPPEPSAVLFKAVISNIQEIVSGGILRAGKTSYGSGTGWWLGIDPADDEAKFDIGTPTDYLRYDETNGVQIAADGSGLTSIDGGNIQAATIVLAGLTSPVTDRMFNTGTLSDNIQAWIHASDATLIDGASIYTGSILVAGLENGIIARMFGSQATRDNIQAWIHASDATLIDGGDIYTGSILVAGLESGIVNRLFGDQATADNIQAWVHASDATLIDGGDIYTNTVTATQIAATTITAAQIAANTITAAQIAAAAITATEIQVGTITFDRMVSGALSNNLIVNPAFEDGSDPHDIATDGGGAWSVQNTTKRGAYALQHNPSGQSATAHCYLNGNPTAANYLYRHIATFEDKKYNFTFYGYRAAATTANTVRAYTRFYDADANLLNAYYTSFDPADWTDDTWTLCISAKTAPANAVYVVFAISILNDGESGSLYFDDIDTRTKIGSGLIEVDAVLAEHINVTNLQAVSAQTGALTVDNTLTMGTNGIITWMSGAAKITDDYMDVALTTSDRYAFRFLDGEAVHAYLAAYKSPNLTQVSIEAIGPAEDKYAKIAFSAIEFIDADPETVDLTIRSDTGVLIAALNYGASRIFKVDTMDAWFTNKVGVGVAAHATYQLDVAGTQRTQQLYIRHTAPQLRYYETDAADDPADFLRQQYGANNLTTSWYDASTSTLYTRTTLEGDTGNLGIATTTPDARLQVVGDCKFGDDDTNYLALAADGELTLTGTARVTIDAYITASGIKAPGSKPATFIEYGICGAWEFSEEIEPNQESIAGTLKLPTQMDKTVAPIFKVGWSAAGASPGNCEWQLEYLYRSPDEATNAAAQATLTATGTASATAEGLVITPFAALALPTATDQAMFFKLTRLSGHANDTIADTVELRGLLFTHTRNKLGTAT